LAYKNSQANGPDRWSLRHNHRETEGPPVEREELTGTDPSVPGRAEGAAAEGEGESRWKNGEDPMTEWTNVDEGVVVKPGQRGESPSRT